MILAMIFRKRNPGRDLARIGIEKHRRDVRETARRIRNELGLPEHAGLRG